MGIYEDLGNVRVTDKKAKYTMSEGIDSKIFYHRGELIEIKAPRMTLIFTKPEWLRVIRRGKAVLRNRQARKRKEKRGALALDAECEKHFGKFPKFE